MEHTVKISHLSFPSVFLVKTEYGFEISFGNNTIPLSVDEAKKLANEIKNLIK